MSTWSSVIFSEFGSAFAPAKRASIAGRFAATVVPFAG